MTFFSAARTTPCLFFADVAGAADDVAADASFPSLVVASDMVTSSPAVPLLGAGADVPAPGSAEVVAAVVDPSAVGGARSSSFFSAWNGA